MLWGMTNAAAQTAAPLVPGRETPPTAPGEGPADGAAVQAPRIPPVFHGVDGRRPPTTGKVLWKYAVVGKPHIIYMVPP